MEARTGAVMRPAEGGPVAGNEAVSCDTESDTRSHIGGCWARGRGGQLAAREFLVRSDLGVALPE